MSGLEMENLKRVNLEKGKNVLRMKLATNPSKCEFSHEDDSFNL